MSGYFDQGVTEALKIKKNQKPNQTKKPNDTTQDHLLHFIGQVKREGNHQGIVNEI